MTSSILRAHHRPSIRYVTALLLAAVLCATPLQAANRALLIGIGDNPGLADLPGTAGDLAIVGKLLRTRLGFADIRQLRDAEATRRGIEQAFERLAVHLAAGDNVYIHFSGYGSHRAGESGHRRHPSWVPYRARAETAGDSSVSHPVSQQQDAGSDISPDISSTAIDRWLAPILTTAGQVVLVSDAGDQVIPYLAQGIVNRAAAPTRVAGRSAATDEPSQDHPLIRISAASTGQIARGNKLIAGQPHGWFSAYWAQALNTAPTGASWDQIFELAARQLRAASDGLQVPTYAGPRGLALPWAATDDLGYQTTVLDVDAAKHSVRLDRGLLEGITEGSVFGAHSPAGADIEVEIIQANISDSIARVIQGHPEPGSQLSERQHQYRLPQHKLYLDAGRFEPPLREAIEGLDAYTLVQDPANADYRVKVARTGNAATRQFTPGAPLPPEQADAPWELWVLSPAGQQIASNLRMSFTDPQRAQRTLVTNLKRLAQYRDVKALTSYRNGRVHLPAARIRFSLLTPDSGCSSSALCQDIPGLGNYRVERALAPEWLKSRGLQRNQILSLTLTNLADQPLYFYVINLGAHGQVAPLFPYPEDPPNIARLGPGRSLDLFEQGYGLLLETRGLETLKVIATQTPIDIGALEQDGYRRRGGQASLNPLERLLAGASLGTRGKDPMPALPGESWGVMDVEFLVR